MRYLKGLHLYRPSYSTHCRQALPYDSLCRRLFTNRWQKLQYLKGHPFVWECHDGHDGVAIPGTYQNIHGKIVAIDPKSLNSETEVMRF